MPKIDLKEDIATFAQKVATTRDFKELDELSDALNKKEDELEKEQEALKGKLSELRSRRRSMAGAMAQVAYKRVTGNSKELAVEKQLDAVTKLLADMSKRQEILDERWQQENTAQKGKIRALYASLGEIISNEGGKLVLSQELTSAPLLEQKDKINEALAILQQLTRLVKTTPALAELQVTLTRKAQAFADPVVDFLMGRDLQDGIHEFSYNLLKNTPITPPTGRLWAGTTPRRESPHRKDMETLKDALDRLVMPKISLELYDSDITEYVTNNHTLIHSLLQEIERGSITPKERQKLLDQIHDVLNEIAGIETEASMVLAKMPPYNKMIADFKLAVPEYQHREAHEVLTHLNPEFGKIEKLIQEFEKIMSQPAPEQGQPEDAPPRRDRRLTF